MANKRDIENRLDVLETEVRPLMKEAVKAIRKHRDAAPGTLDQKILAEVVEKSIAPRLEPLQREIQGLKAKLAEKEAALQEKGVRTRQYRPEGAERAADNEAFKNFRNAVMEGRNPGNSIMTSGKIEVGSFFRKGIDYVVGRDPRARQVKAPSLVLDTGTNAPIVTPQYEDDLLLQPRLASVVRDLCDSVRTDATNAVISYREVRKGSPTTTMTGDISDAATTINVSSASGISTVYPFNKLTLRDGTNTEVVTVTAISGAALTVTRAATSYAFTAALTTVELKAVNRTQQGVLKPQFFSTMESYNVPIVKLADFMKVTNEAIADVRGIDSFIADVGSIFISEMEDWNFLYGPGGGAGADRAMTGLFVDSDIESLTRNSGETLFNFLIRSYYNRRAEGVQPGDVLVSVENHRELSSATGADGHYIWNIDRPEGMPESVFIGRVHMSDKLQSTDAMLGDFQTACRIYDRMDATVDFGLDGSDFSENKITARFESRVGLGIRLPRFLLKLDTTAS